MQRHHIYTLGILLAAFGVIVSGLDHWHDAIKPSFVAGALGVLGAVLKGMYQPGPGEK
jgi:hypothetical protein